mmetsp:Transcript_24965/g.55981  ORF Transcript_24965/g.55981 Transcript_24965/m.55981 type:complete len:335 (-) Transcript_24965:228-1232(-)
MPTPMPRCLFVASKVSLAVYRTGALAFSSPKRAPVHDAPPASMWRTIRAPMLRFPDGSYVSDAVYDRPTVGVSSPSRAPVQDTPDVSMWPTGSHGLGGSLTLVDCRGGADNSTSCSSSSPSSKPSNVSSVTPSPSSSSTIIFAPVKSSSCVYELFVTRQLMPEATAAPTPMWLSSTMTQRLLSSPILSTAILYTSGAGFFALTMSPAKIWNLAARSGPMSVETRLDTASSFDVEHTASLTLFAIASSTSASTPGLRGILPSSMSFMNMSVFCRWRDLTLSCRPSSGICSGHPTSFQWAVIRSFPPPVSRSFPYLSFVQSSAMSFCANAMLNPTR